MKTRKTYIDILKLISIFLVLNTHTGTDVIFRYTVTSGFSHYISFALSEIIYVGPKLFFIISGCLLLGKEESVGKVLTHRVLRYTVVLILFSILQMLFCHKMGTDGQFSLWATLKTMYYAPVITQYWFLYAYLGILLMLPFLRMIARNMDKKNAIYLLGLYFVFELFFPILESAFNLNEINLSLQILDYTLFLPLVGYCLDAVLDEEVGLRRNRIALYLACIVFVGMDLFRSHRSYLLSGETKSWDGVLTILAITLLVLTKGLFDKHIFKERTAKIFARIGESIFIIYLLEPQLRGGSHIVYSVLSPYIGWGAAAFIWICCAILLGVLLALIIHLISGSKKYI